MTPLGLLSGLYGLWDLLTQVSLPIECFLVNLDNLHLPLNLGFVAARHGDAAALDIDSVHPLLKLIILLLVHHLLLLDVDLTLLSLPLLLLHGLLILDYIAVNDLEVLKLLHAVLQLDFDVL